MGSEPFGVVGRRAVSITMALLLAVAAAIPASPCVTQSAITAETCNGNASCAWLATPGLCSPRCFAYNKPLCNDSGAWCAWDTPTMSCGLQCNLVGDDESWCRSEPRCQWWTANATCTAAPSVATHSETSITIANDQFAIMYSTVGARPSLFSALQRDLNRLYASLAPAASIVWLLGARTVINTTAGTVIVTIAGPATPPATLTNQVGHNATSFVVTWSAYVAAGGNPFTPLVLQAVETIAAAATGFGTSAPSLSSLAPGVSGEASITTTTTTGAADLNATEIASLTIGSILLITVVAGVVIWGWRRNPYAPAGAFTEVNGSDIAMTALLPGRFTQMEFEYLKGATEVAIPFEDILAMQDAHEGPQLTRAEPSDVEHAPHNAGASPDTMAIVVAKYEPPRCAARDGRQREAWNALCSPKLFSVALRALCETALVSVDDNNRIRCPPRDAWNIHHASGALRCIANNTLSETSVGVSMVRIGGRRLRFATTRDDGVPPRVLPTNIAACETPDMSARVKQCMERCGLCDTLGMHDARKVAFARLRRAPTASVTVASVAVIDDATQAGVLRPHNHVVLGIPESGAWRDPAHVTALLRLIYAVGISCFLSSGAPKGTSVAPPPLPKLAEVVVRVAPCAGEGWIVVATPPSALNVLIASANRFWCTTTSGDDAVVGCQCASGIIFTPPDDEGDASLPRL